MTHGRIDYLQRPARDIPGSAAFYAAVFGWTVEGNSFTAPGTLGQWTTERAVIIGSAHTRPKMAASCAELAIKGGNLARATS